MKPPLTDCREALLACLRPEADDATAARLAPLDGAEWEEVARLAARLGVAPLVYHRLRALGRRLTAPEPVVRGLREHYLRSAGANTRLYHELGQVLRALAARGIPAILLKGAWLAEAVYGDIALRPMADIDLLLRRGEVVAGARILLESGYRPQAAHEACRSECHVAPLRRPGGRPIELHWTILSSSDPFPVDVEGLWGRARPVTVAGVHALALAPEDALLHLCLHAGWSDEFGGALRSFCDVARLSRRCFEPADWERLSVRARAWNAVSILRLYLRLCREHVGAAIPEEVLAALDGPEVEDGTTAAIRERLWSEDPGALHGPRDPENVSRFLRGGRLRDRLALLKESLFLSREDLSLMFLVPPDSSWIYWYYLVRARALFRRYAGRAWQAAWGKRAALASGAQRPAPRELLRPRG